MRPRERRSLLTAGTLLFTVTLALVWLTVSNPPAVRVLEPMELPPAGRLVLPNQLGSLKLAVLGDAGRGDRLQYETAGELVRWRERFEFEDVLFLGDNIYGTGTDDDYRTKFEVPYKPLLDRGVTFHAVPGNHDPENITSYPPFNMQGRRYYAFERSFGLPLLKHRVLFVAIDSVRLAGGQLAWVRQQLESDAYWTIAFLHYPLYSSGRYWFRASRTRAALESLFVNGGVDVAFSGHEHLYERTVPQKGVQYFTSGGAGTVRVGDLNPSRITANGFDRDTHFMLVEVSSDAIHFQVIDRGGATVDFGAIQRPADGKPTQLPG